MAEIDLYSVFEFLVLNMKYQIATREVSRKKTFVNFMDFKTYHYHKSFNINEKVKITKSLEM